jgi:hypothetical protein
MTVQTYGSLAETGVLAELARAQTQPERYSIYLIRENGQKRTSAQNRLFHKLLQKLAQQQGRSVTFWRDYLVERFLGLIEVETADGDIRHVLQPTSELNVEEFTGFLNACLVYAGDLQVH